MPKRKKVHIKERPSKKKKKSTSFDTFIEDLRKKVDRDFNDVTAYRHKSVSATNQRLGYKTYVNEPYPGAPDIPLPETDKLIEKTKPALILSIWANKKLATVGIEQGVKITDELKKKAKRAEEALNMILRTKMDLFNTLECGADLAKELGKVIFRTFEKFTVRQHFHAIDVSEYTPKELKEIKAQSFDEFKEWASSRFALDLEDDDDVKVIRKGYDELKAGKEKIEFITTSIISYPCVEARSPLEVTVPSFTKYIGDSIRVCDEMKISKVRFLELMNDGAFEQRSMKELESQLKNSKSGDVAEQNNQYIEGVTEGTYDEDMLTLQLVSTWYYDEEKENPKPERWVIVFIKGVQDAKLACVKQHRYPYDEFDSWNYDAFDNERRSDRHYASRGIPEKVRALQEIMERSVNNMLIRDEQNNTPQFEVLETSDILRRQDGFLPGEFVAVKALGQEIKPFPTNPSVDASSERIMQIMKAYAEEYISVTDQLFRNATNKGGGKTLGEVEMGASLQQKPVQVDIIRWNNTLSKVFTKVFLILRERFGDSIYLSDGSAVTREDFNFPAEIRANGSLEVSDNEFATRKAFARLNTISNPVFQDFVSIEDRYNAFKDWLEKDGSKDPDEFSTQPKEILQGQLEQMKQAVMQLRGQAEQLQKTLQDGETELARLQKSGRKAVSKTEGEMKEIAQEIQGNDEIR